MVMSANEAADKYENGVSAIGAQAYRNAKGTNSPSEAAQILEDAAGDRLTVSNMREAYEDAY